MRRLNTKGPYECRALVANVNRRSSKVKGGHKVGEKRVARVAVRAETSLVRSQSFCTTGRGDENEVTKKEELTLQLWLTWLHVVVTLYFELRRTMVNVGFCSGG
jgi:hypothetical protein